MKPERNEVNAVGDPNGVGAGTLSVWPNLHHAQRELRQISQRVVVQRDAASTRRSMKSNEKIVTWCGYVQVGSQSVKTTQGMMVRELRRCNLVPG